MGEAPGGGGGGAGAQGGEQGEATGGPCDHGRSHGVVGGGVLRGAGSRVRSQPALPAAARSSIAQMAISDSTIFETAVSAAAPAFPRPSSAAEDDASSRPRWQTPLPARAGRAGGGRNGEMALLGDASHLLYPRPSPYGVPCHVPAASSDTASRLLAAHRQLQLVGSEQVAVVGIIGKVSRRSTRKRACFCERKSRSASLRSCARVCASLLTLVSPRRRSSARARC